ncbi:MAG: arsenosugar biosynthesis radical SAM protein ArsS [Cytophagaceae bacterium]|nr:arsenosugar biosynthesis radical SAM protein ArsS [Cytophagaceae bacterium]
MKSLRASQHPLSHSQQQLDVLDQPALPPFAEKLATYGLNPLRPTGIEIFQVNLGKMCNQTCAHCHVDAGPDRKEIMTRATMQQCLHALAQTDISTVDLTGGAPEMNPDFRWFVEEVKKLGRHVMVRCNLTIIVANPKYRDLPEFYARHGVEVVSSLPFYEASRTDRQRGNGVFQDSIEALKLLNAVGYGQPGTGLTLNLVYNPAGAFMPPPQAELERDFKLALQKNHGVAFNSLFAITNMPISRYLDYLMRSGNYEKYMEKLVNAFNPTAALNVMCRNTISVGWDGRLYDCDFNQMLDLTVESTAPQHVSDFNVQALNDRNIVLKQHCYGCTAGAGSSCGGEVAA